MNLFLFLLLTVGAIAFLHSVWLPALRERHSEGGASENITRALLRSLLGSLRTALVALAVASALILMTVFFMKLMGYVSPSAVQPVVDSIDRGLKRLESLSEHWSHFTLAALASAVALSGISACVKVRDGSHWPRGLLVALRSEGLRRSLSLVARTLFLANVLLLLPEFLDLYSGTQSGSLPWIPGVTSSQSEQKQVLLPERSLIPQSLSSLDPLVGRIRASQGRSDPDPWVWEVLARTYERELTRSALYPRPSSGDISWELLRGAVQRARRTDARKVLLRGPYLSFADRARAATETAGPLTSEGQRFEAALEQRARSDALFKDRVRSAFTTWCKEYIASFSKEAQVRSLLLDVAAEELSQSVEAVAGGRAALLSDALDVPGAGAEATASASEHMKAVKIARALKENWERNRHRMIDRLGQGMGVRQALRAVESLPRTASVTAALQPVASKLGEEIRSERLHQPILNWTKKAIDRPGLPSRQMLDRGTFDGRGLSSTFTKIIQDEIDARTHPERAEDR